MFCYASINISDFLSSYVDVNCTGVVRRHINRGMHFAFLLLEPTIRASVYADKYGNWAGLHELSLLPLIVYVLLPNG
jgi:hypothetical protein